MIVLINGIGLVASFGALMMVLPTAHLLSNSLKRGLSLFGFGFILFSIGFFWNILAELNILIQLDILFFSLGMIFILFGAERTLSFSDAKTI
jgi:hypothetical protein